MWQESEVRTHLREGELLSGQGMEFQSLGDALECGVYGQCCLRNRPFTAFLMVTAKPSLLTAFTSSLGQVLTKEQQSPVIPVINLGHGEMDFA